MSASPRCIRVDSSLMRRLSLAAAFIDKGGLADPHAGGGLASPVA